MRRGFKSKSMYRLDPIKFNFTKTKFPKLTPTKISSSTKIFSTTKRYRNNHIGDPSAGIKAILFLIGLGAVVEMTDFFINNPVIAAVVLLILCGIGYVIYKLRKVLDVMVMIKIVSLFMISIILIKWYSLIILAIAGLYLWIDNIKFYNSEYWKESYKSYWETILNIGTYGEYLTFLELSKLEGSYKIVANAYVPKEDGEDTEIDLVLIHEKGIFVIESKNYSGWIYGNDKDKNWTITYNRIAKTTFYNPVWQNESHIKWLEKHLNINNTNIYSMIVFSDRCSIKNVSFSRPKTDLIQRQNLLDNIRFILSNNEIIYNFEQIQNMYLKLKKCTYKTDEEKQKHIDNIKMHKGNIHCGHIHTIPEQNEECDVTDNLCHPEQSETESKDLKPEPSYIKSAKLYMKYKDEHQVAKERGLTPMTVQNHIVQAYHEGFDFGDMQLMTEEHRKLIHDAIGKAGTGSLKAIKAELPDDVGYLEIKIVMGKVNKNEK